MPRVRPVRSPVAPQRLEEAISMIVVGAETYTSASLTAVAVDEVGPPARPSRRASQPYGACSRGRRRCPASGCGLIEDCSLQA